MITDVAQRYTLGRESRRPAGEVIRVSAYDVEEIDRDVAALFVETHHYAHSCGSRSHTFGLFERGTHAGTAVFGALASMNAHRKVFPTLGTRTGVTLNRFVLVDSVPGNGESWFLARCFELLRAKGIIGVESCADPVHGHIGRIYQATNGHHIGRTNRATRYILPDGTELSNRASSKLTGGERGYERAISKLVAFGAEHPRRGADLTAWLRHWRPRITRTFRHPGNFRYLWCLDKRHRREVMRFPALAYPKVP